MMRCYRLVQKLYTAHAVITFVSVTDAVRKSGKTIRSYNYA